MGSEQMSGWYGIDLDGTLAFYDGWRGELHIGDPIPEMLSHCKDLQSAGWELRIFTARVSEQDDRDVREVTKIIQDWCELHGLGRLVVTNTKDYQMVGCYDDRSVQVFPNTGRTVVSAMQDLMKEINELKLRLEQSSKSQRKKAFKRNNLIRLDHEE